MDPEQRLLIIHEYFSVKCDILILRTLARVLRPQRMDVADGDRALHDLDFLLRLALFSFFLLFLDMLYDLVCIQQVLLVYRLIFRLCIRLGQEDLDRHKGTVLLQHFSRTVLVGKLQAVLVQEQSNLRTYSRLVSILHLILRAALACPVNRSRAFLIGKRIDLHLVRHHKCGVESETEVTDHIVLCRLIFIFLKELRRTGKGDLCNVFFHFFRSHSKTVVNKLHRLLFRVDDDLNLRLIPFREFIFAHHVQFLQLSDRIASVGDHLADENVMIGIYPFFNNREYILTVDR